MRITNNESSYDRNSRLFRVVDFYYAMMRRRGYGQEKGGKYETVGTHPKGSTEIIHVHDHKGVLTVSWAAEPSADERLCMAAAWEEAAGECESNINHLVGAHHVI